MTAPATTTCAECGWRDEPAWSRPPLPPLHWRRLAPIGAWLIFLGVVAVVAWRAGESRRGGSGMPAPGFIQPPVSSDQLVAIADGALELPSGERLADRLLESIPDVGRPMTGDVALDVRLEEPAGSRIDVRSRGWPLPFVVETRQAAYNQPLSREGFVPARSNPDPEARLRGPWDGVSDLGNVNPSKRWQWSGLDLIHRVPPEETEGILREWRYPLAPWLVAVALGFIVWAAWSIVARIVGCVRGTGVRRRWAVVAAVAVMAASVVGGAFVKSDMTRVRPEHARLVRVPGANVSNFEGYARISQRRSALASGPRDATLDRALARSILDLTGTPNEGWLVVAAVPEAVSTSTGWSTAVVVPLFGVSDVTYTRRSDFGSVATMAAAPSVSMIPGYGQVFVSLGTPGGDDPARIVSLSLVGLSLVVATSGVVYVGTHRAGALVSALQRRRRRRRGRCPECGHHLGAGT